MKTNLWVILFTLLVAIMFGCKSEEKEPEEIRFFGEQCPCGTVFVKKLDGNIGRLFCSVDDPSQFPERSFESVYKRKLGPYRELRDGQLVKKGWYSFDIQNYWWWERRPDGTIIETLFRNGIQQGPPIIERLKSAEQTPFVGPPEPSWHKIAELEVYRYREWTTPVVIEGICGAVFGDSGRYNEKCSERGLKGLHDATCACNGREQGCELPLECPGGMDLDSPPIPCDATVLICDWREGYPHNR